MTSPNLFGSDNPVPTPSPSTTSGQSQSLYRKYRPQSFDDDDLVGQEHVVHTLRNAIALGRVAHAYLFCGPRGTGKTTTARLLAKAVNCDHPDPQVRPCNACRSCLAISTGATTDVIEIDAASNRGIDDIRDLRERVKYAPTQLRTKFYIIDEAHQITGAAANAFLKTLEEPPAHTKFVLATTDPEELLATIVSRCQRFDFRRINLDAMSRRIKTVALAESITINDEAIQVIARHATGSLRDALGLLDQVSVYREESGDGSLAEIDAAAVRTVLGVSKNDRIEQLVTAIADRDAGAALGVVSAAMDAGEDPRQLNRQLVTYLRLLLHQRAGGSPDADDRAKALATRFPLNELANLARMFSEVDYQIKRSITMQLPLEVTLVEATMGMPQSAPTAMTAPRAVAAQPAPSAVPTQVRPAPTAPTPVAPINDAAGDRPAGPSLRDRVRSSGRPPAATVPPTLVPTPDPHSQEPDQIPVVTRPVAVSQTAGSDDSVQGTPIPFLPRSARESGSEVDVDQLMDLWGRIRNDVKAINRRIEALLVSVDPVAVQGGQIVLATPYPFHLEKMNADDTRLLVEDVIGRIIGQTVTVSCILRGGDPSAVLTGMTVAQPAAPARPPAARRTPSEPMATPSSAQQDADAPPAEEPNSEPDSERRIKAAKNIFDAEEV